MDDIDQVVAADMTDEELREIEERYGPEADAALELAREKGVHNLTFGELLAASSLGTPMALHMRSQTPPEVTADLKRRLRGSGSTADEA